jgi:hypothetical protein
MQKFIYSRELTLFMAEICIKIPEDLEFLKNVPKVDWSILLNEMIKSKLEEISRLKKIVSKSKLTQKDVEELSDKVNTALAKRFDEYVRGKK